MTTETPAEELKRLVGEYISAHNRPLVKAEAWSLIADFTVEHVDEICAALARRSAASAEPAVAVKALIWKAFTDAFEARTTFGRYMILRYPADDFRPEAYGWTHEGSFGSGGQAPQLDIAKAAAQADYEARIISALAAPPSPVASEAMISEGEPRAVDTWPDPTPEMLDAPVFNAIWCVVKHWDVNVPDQYAGYCGATGNHVRAIYDAINTALSHAPAGEAGWRTRFVTWLEGEIAELERMIDKGQGEHGKPGYVREAIWHAWHGRLSALRSARHQLPALPASPTGGDKP